MKQRKKHKENIKKLSKEGRKEEIDKKKKNERNVASKRRQGKKKKNGRIGHMEIRA